MESIKSENDNLPSKLFVLQKYWSLGAPLVFKDFLDSTKFVESDSNTSINRVFE